MTLNEVIHRLQEQEMQSPSYRRAMAIQSLHGSLSELRSLGVPAQEEGDLLSARDMLDAIIGGAQ